METCNVALAFDAAFWRDWEICDFDFPGTRLDIIYEAVEPDCAGIAFVKAISKLLSSMSELSIFFKYPMIGSN